MPIDFITDDFVDIPDDNSLDISDEITISAFIKTNDATLVQSIFSKREFEGVDDELNYLFRIEGAGLNDNDLAFWYRDAGLTYHSYETSGNVINDTTGYHVAVVYKSGVAGSAIIYVDGVAKTASWVNGDGTGSFSANNHPAEIGQSNFLGTLQNFSGIIDEMALWNKILTATEIGILASSHIKHMPLQIQASNLKAYWPMDDGLDGTSADGDTVRDLSVNGNNGIGDDGANNTGLTWKAEEVLSYLPGIIPVILPFELTLLDFERGYLRGDMVGSYRGEV